MELLRRPSLGPGTYEALVNYAPPPPLLLHAGLSSLRRRATTPLLLVNLEQPGRRLGPLQGSTP